MLYQESRNHAIISQKAVRTRIKVKHAQDTETDGRLACEIMFESVTETQDRQLLRVSSQTTHVKLIRVNSLWLCRWANHRQYSPGKRAVVRERKNVTPREVACEKGNSRTTETEQNTRPFYLFPKHSSYSSSVINTALTETIYPSRSL